MDEQKGTAELASPQPPKDFLAEMREIERRAQERYERMSPEERAAVDEAARAFEEYDY